MEERKQEIQKLEDICKPIVDYLRKKHPHYCIIIDSEAIRLNETVIGIPIDKPR